MVANQPPNQPDSGSPSGTTVPISPAVRKQLQRCFDRAKEVLRQDKPDHDYAHTMFAECVLKDPGNLEYVEALLENLQRKYKNNKRGSMFKGFGGRSVFKKAVAAEDWDEVFSEGLDLLKANPWDVPVLRALAEACRARHLNEVELRYLKNALDVDRKDIEVNRHCAESLSRMGQFDQAIACWHRIEELDKGNIEARKKISELTIAKTMGLPGIDTSASHRPPGHASPRPLTAAEPSNSASSGSAAGQPRTVSTTSRAENAPTTPPTASPSPEETIANMQARLQRDPSDLEAYQVLAKTFTEQGRLRDAFQALKRALEATGGNHQAIQQELEDAQIRMIRGQVAIAEKRAAAENTSEAQDLVRRFRSELNRQELLILAARSERFPQDLSLRLELGLRLKREANYREAIKSLDAARGDTDLKAQATLEMGECYQQLKQYSQALKCYQSAIAATAPASEWHHLALYRAGILATALKNLEIAEDCLGALVKSDPNFRDAAARLDKLREIRDKE